MNLRTTKQPLTDRLIGSLVPRSSPACNEARTGHLHCPQPDADFSLGRRSTSFLRKMCVPSDSLVLLEARLLGWWSILHTKSSLIVWQLAWNPKIYERDCINTAFMDNLVGIVDSFQVQQVWQLQKTLRCMTFQSSISISSKNDMQKNWSNPFQATSTAFWRKTYLPKKTFPLNLNCPRYPPPWIHSLPSLDGFRGPALSRASRIRWIFQR